MNRTLLEAFWRQRLTSPVRLVLLAFIVIMPLLLTMASRGGMGFTALGDMGSIVLVFAAGMIGQDVSSGVLQLLFTRPIRRWEYVISRWLAVGLAAATVGVLQAVLAWGALHLGGAPPAATALAAYAAGRVVDAFGIAAVMALFSGLFDGLGDLAAYVVLNIGGAMAMMAGQAMGRPSIAAIGRELGAFLAPHFEVAQVLSAHPTWYAPAAYASTVTICLVGAIFLVNRKELSYASG